MAAFAEEGAHSGGRQRENTVPTVQELDQQPGLGQIQARSGPDLVVWYQCLQTEPLQTGFYIRVERLVHHLLKSQFIDYHYQMVRVGINCAARRDTEKKTHFQKLYGK